MAQRKLVLIASDHAALDLKTQLQTCLPEWDWMDLGPSDADRVDYPDYAEKLAKKIQAGTADTGILLCGSGIGMSIAANKFDGIRAALVENPVAARLSREHNDANILCLGARFLAPAYATEIARVFLETPFSNDSRHEVRVKKINALDKKRK